MSALLLVSLLDWSWDCSSVSMIAAFGRAGPGLVAAVVVGEVVAGAPGAQQRAGIVRRRSNAVTSAVDQGQSRSSLRWVRRAWVPSLPAVCSSR